MKKKIAVVTGGAGFLGSHLCDRLLADGCRVIAIDNLLTGSLRNITHLRNNKDFDFIKRDVCRPWTIKGKVDYILHFASPASPVDYLQHPLLTLKVGSQGTENGLALAKLKKARFLIASTSEIYGDPLEHPQKETYWGHVNSIGPRSVYDEAKRFAEAITMAYHRSYNVDTAIVRIFNTYGPRMQVNDGRVVPNFIDQALHSHPLTIYGNGKQTRSFCYYSDLIDGIVRLLYSDLHQPVNIGNPKEFTILEFAKLVLEFTGAKSRLVYRTLPVDDPKQRCPDITLAKKYLKWQPKVSLEQGLQETLAWFKVNACDEKQ
jgi:dTDP-glucose 4,6-dehydratase